MGSSEFEKLRRYILNRLMSVFSGRDDVGERRLHNMYIGIRRRATAELGLKYSRDIEEKHLERAKQIADREIEILRRKLEMKDRK